MNHNLQGGGKKFHGGLWRYIKNKDLSIVKYTLVGLCMSPLVRSKLFIAGICTTVTHYTLYTLMQGFSNISKDPS